MCIRDSSGDGADNNGGTFNRRISDITSDHTSSLTSSHCGGIIATRENSTNQHGPQHQGIAIGIGGVGGSNGSRYSQFRRYSSTTDVKHHSPSIGSGSLGPPVIPQRRSSTTSVLSTCHRHFVNNGLDLNDYEEEEEQDDDDDDHAGSMLDEVDEEKPFLKASMAVRNSSTSTLSSSAVAAAVTAVPSIEHYHTSNTTANTTPKVKNSSNGAPPTLPIRQASIM